LSSCAWEQYCESLISEKAFSLLNVEAHYALQMTALGEAELVVEENVLVLELTSVLVSNRYQS